MNVLGREIPDDDKRLIAGARCWIEDGYIVKATKVREVTGKVARWRSEQEPVDS